MLAGWPRAGFSNTLTTRHIWLIGVLQKLCCLLIYLFILQTVALLHQSDGTSRLVAYSPNIISSFINWPKLNCYCIFIVTHYQMTSIGVIALSADINDLSDHHPVSIFKYIINFHVASAAAEFQTVSFII